MNNDISRIATLFPRRENAANADVGAPQAGEPIAGVILAGGLSRRMGSDKTWKMLGNTPLIDHVTARIKPQVDRLILNTNQKKSPGGSNHFPIVPDCLPGKPGPLVGVLSAMLWARQQTPAYHWVASVSVDTPFLPLNLVAKLAQAIRQEKTPIACAVSGDHRHAICALWPVALADDLATCLTQGMRKIEAWTARHGVATYRFPVQPFDPFFNINRPEDLTQALAILTASKD